MSIVYGPVPWWRLGRSLGIDLISAQCKTCTFDCVYCHLGRTTCFADQRQVFTETEQPQAELATLPPIEIDYVTFSGTGEPTLAANLGEWPALQGVPTAVLTNASLRSHSGVRSDLARADLVVAKMHAADEVQLNTPLRPSPTPFLGRTELAEIEAASAGLPVVSVYSAQPPEVRPLNGAEMRRWRPAEGQPKTVEKEVN